MPTKLQHNVRDVLLRNSIPSTQTSLTQWLSSKPLDRYHQTSLCIAETQTQGVGRRGTAWHSPAGKNIYLSVATLLKTDEVTPLLSPAVGIELAANFTQLLSSAPEESKHKHPTIKVKWPNDLVFQSIEDKQNCLYRKVGGILITTFTQPAPLGMVVIIGVGINVSLTNNDHKKINQVTTSLQEITGSPINQLVAASTACKSVLQVIQATATKALPTYQQRWQAADIFANQEITLQSPNGAHKGMNKGIDDKGALQLETEASGKKHIRSLCIGEVSIRTN